MNTRLQVEHGVTEQVTGVDLVEWMVRGAAGDLASLDACRRRPPGASIQVRALRRGSGQDFRPSCGVLTQVAFPPDARGRDLGGDGTEVSACYDPLLAKLIVTAPDRADARCAPCSGALDRDPPAGIETNLGWLRAGRAQRGLRLAGRSPPRPGDVAYPSAPRASVLSGGPRHHGAGLSRPARATGTSACRPRGPMDALAFRLGNRLLGNPRRRRRAWSSPPHGPTLLFNARRALCLTGADFDAHPGWRAARPLRAVAARPARR